MISEQNKLYTLTDDPPKQEDPSEQVDKDLPQKVYLGQTHKYSNLPPVGTLEKYGWTLQFLKFD